MPEMFTERLRVSKRIVVGLAVSSGLMIGAAAFAVEAASAQTDEPKVPEYQVLDIFEASGVVEVDVSTAAMRDSGMKLIAEDLRENEANVPESGTLLIEYYDDEDNSENTGFAMVFDDEEAVMESGESEQFGQVYDLEDAERIIESEDGIRTVSFKDFKEDNSGIWNTVKRFLF